jgi:hypothetical protein
MSTSARSDNAFALTVAINVGTAAVVVAVFALVFKKNRAVYLPRLPADAEAPANAFAALWRAFRTPPDELVAASGPDALVFTRFMEFGVKTFSVLSYVCVICVAVTVYWPAGWHVLILLLCPLSLLPFRCFSARSRHQLRALVVCLPCCHSRTHGCGCVCLCADAASSASSCSCP